MTQRPSGGPPITPVWHHPLVVGGAILALALFGLYARLDGISASLWLDEFGTFWVVENDLITAFRRAWQFQGQSPFYYVLAWIPVHLIGESEAALRAPSLIFGCVFVAALYAAARLLSGPTAGLYAALFSWLSVPCITSSAEARPYALVLASLAIALLGYQWAVSSGDRWGRVLWTLGGAAVAWSHYVQYPTVIGLFVAYLLLPDLRTRYSTRKFMVDGLCQLGLVSLCTPQIVNLSLRHGALSWLGGSDFSVPLTLLLPLIPAIVLGEALTRGRNGDRTGKALRRSLWYCLLAHAIVLNLAALGGVNLLASRYFIGILVPGVLLAATGVARIRRGEAFAAFLGFAILTGFGLSATKRTLGTYSGLGYDDWRGAAAELSARTRGMNKPLVLLRSGFVEEDSLPLGSPGDATLAPLRSPGRPRVGWEVKPLTYRWNNPRREAYFRTGLSPGIQESDRFFVLTGRWSPEQMRYGDEFIRWVSSTWEREFVVTRTSFGGVELLEFRRTER